MPPPQSAHLNALPDGVLPDNAPLPDGVMPDTQGLPDGVLPDAPAGDVVNLVSPTGQIVGMPRAQVPAALQQQYREPTAQDLAKASSDETYGGAGQALGAFAEGAGSALTFGVAPKLETMAGLTTPEAIRGRQEAHPVAHALGTVAGVVAPLALTAGAAAPLEAGEGASALSGLAELTAPALIARAGRAAAGVAEGAPGLIGRVLPTLAAGATEGALYAGSDVTEKALLGDPQLTWEKAASELGIGALLGGGLAGATEGATRGLGKILGKASEGLESVAARVAKGDPDVVKLMLNAKHELHAFEESVPGATEAISASSPETAKFILKNLDKIQKLEGEFPGLTDILSRASPETGADVLKNWGKLLKDPQARIAVGNAQAEAVQKAYSSLEDGLQIGNRDVRPEELDRLASGMDHAKAHAAFSRLQDRVASLAKTMRDEPDLYQSSAARELELISDGMTRDAAATPVDTFKLLNRSKQLIDSQAKFGKLIQPEWRRTADAMKSLRSDFRDALEDPKIWGAAGERQGAFNAAQNAYFTTRTRLQKLLMQQAVTPSGRVVFEVSPTKVNSWINLMADGRGGAKSQVFNEYLHAAGKLADELGTSGYEGAEALRGQVRQILDQTADIQQRATVTQTVKMLQGHEILSSGPAIPMGQRMALEAAKRLPGGVGHIVGGITGTISRAREPSVMVGVLSTLDKLAKKASTKLQSAGESVFRSGVGGAAAGGAAEKFSKGGMVTPERFADVSTSLRNYGGNLDALADQVSRETSTLKDHAPATADAAHAFAARVVSHLGAKLPVSGPRQVLDPEFEPSRSELAAYNRHHDVAMRGPTAVLEHLANGTLLPEHIETSQALYPKLHAEAQQLVADKLAEHLAKKRHLPIAMRPALSQFLGGALDHASTPQAILAAQNTYSAAAAAGDGQPPTLAGGRTRNVEIHADDRLASGTQGNETSLRRV